MPRKHRNPFIPYERAREMEDPTLIAEKEAKQRYTRQQARIRSQGAPQKQRIQKRERQKQIESDKAATPTEEE